MKVMYIMTREVITCPPDMSVDDAKALMRRHHISGLPVVDEKGYVQGIFSQTDALNEEGQIVSDLMTTMVVSIEEMAPIKEAAALMAAKDINRLPVLRDGLLVGVISRSDVVRYVATHHAWLDFQEMESCRLAP